MIGKRIRRQSTTTSPQALAKAISNLTSYVTAGHAGDKCIYTTSSGMIGSTVDAWEAEMTALAMESRSKFPVRHLVLSWAPSEQPTLEQCDEALAITLKHLGLEHHQAIAGLHVDTGIHHLHIIANRVDPVTEQATEINRGWEAKAIQQAAALVEHKQGWQRVSNARWEVVEGGRVVRIGKGAADKTPERDGPSDRIRDIERQSGQQTTISAAAERLLPILETATSWEQLHRDLAAAEARYETKGSGAIIWFEGRAVKASSLSSRVSLSKMERRLDKYVAAPENERPAPARVKGEPAKLAWADQNLWNAFLENRRIAHRERRERMRQLRAQQKAERAELLANQRAARSELRTAFASEPVAERRQGRLIIEKQQREQRATVAALHKSQRDLTIEATPILSTYTRWLRASADKLDERAAQELAALAGRKSVQAPTQPVQRGAAAPAQPVQQPRTFDDMSTGELKRLYHYLVAKELQIRAGAAGVPVDKFTAYFTTAEQAQVSHGAGLPPQEKLVLDDIHARLVKNGVFEQEQERSPLLSLALSKPLDDMSPIELARIFNRLAEKEMKIRADAAGILIAQFAEFSFEEQIKLGRGAGLPPQEQQILANIEDRLARLPKDAASEPDRPSVPPTAPSSAPKTPDKDEFEGLTRQQIDALRGRGQGH